MIESCRTENGHLLALTSVGVINKVILKERELCVHSAPCYFGSYHVYLDEDFGKGDTSLA